MFIQHAQLQHTFYTHRLPRTAGQISQQNACCVSLGATAYSPEPTGKSWHGSMFLVNSAQGRWVDMGGFLGLPGRPTSLNLPCVFQANERACLKNKTGGTRATPNCGCPLVCTSYTPFMCTRTLVYLHT